MSRSGFLESPSRCREISDGGKLPVGVRLQRTRVSSFTRREGEGIRSISRTPSPLPMGRSSKSYESARKSQKVRTRKRKNHPQAKKTARRY